MSQSSADQGASQRLARRPSGRQWTVIALVVVGLAALVVVGLDVARAQAPQPDTVVIEMTYHDFMSYVDANKVSSVVIQSDGNITGQLKHAITYRQSNGVTVTGESFHTYQRLTITGALYLDFALDRHGVKIYQQRAPASDPWIAVALDITPIVILLSALVALGGGVALIALAMRQPRKIAPGAV